MSIVKNKLRLDYLDGKHWMVAETFKAYSHVLSQWITVDKGFITDFNSIPRGFWNVFLPSEFGEAAVLHDVLYQRGENKGKPVTREQADNVHKEFLEWEPPPPRKRAPQWKVLIMFRILRLCGWKRWNEYRSGNATGK